MADGNDSLNDADALALRAHAQATATNQSQQDDQTVDQCLEMALPALESGIAPDTIINAMFANLPDHIKQMLRQRMGQAVAAKDAREHEMARQTREKGEVSRARRAMFDLTAVAALISEQTLERIKKIFMQRPDLAQAITQEGARLLRHGVAPELVRMSEAQLGQISPPAIGQGQGRALDGGVNR